MYLYVAAADAVDENKRYIQSAMNIQYLLLLDGHFPYNREGQRLHFSLVLVIAILCV
jgi:hypothetical protein